MSLTEDEKNRLLTGFFNQNIVRLHGAPGMDRLERGAPDSSNSYFVSRKTTQMRKEDFELALADENELAVTLEAFWQGTPLAGVGRELGNLAVRFRSEKPKSEVSSLIYEMF